MKKTRLIFFYILSFFLINDGGAHTPELLAEECTVIAAMMSHLPPAKQREVTNSVLLLQQQDLPRDRLYAALHELRLQLVPHTPRYMAGNEDPTIITGYGLDKVWQALIYCGIGCCIFLIITGIQNADAQALLNNEKNHLTKIKKRHVIIVAATEATQKVVRAVTNQRGDV